MLLKTATLVALFAVTVTAQSIFVPDNNAGTGGCNVIPFGHSAASATWQNQRYQQLATAADLGNKQVGTICDIAFPPCGSKGATFIRHFDTIEVVMGQTNANSLSLTFSSNLVANVQTVLSAKNYDWHQTSSEWNRLGLQKSYLYIAAQGKNLVVQVTVTGARHLTNGQAGMRMGTRQRIYRFSYTGTPPPTAQGTSMHALKTEFLFQVGDLHEFGVGCKGTAGTPELKLSGSPQIGKSLSVELSKAPAVRPYFHAIALSSIDGGFDLGILGAPGCRQYVPPTILLAGATSSTGTAALNATLPNNPAIVCTRVYTQFFPLDVTANPAGLTASNYGRIMPGN